jgi:pyruvate,orthophosphate dikinase
VATTKWVYSFEEADGGNKDLFGGKGGNLAAMTALGLPIPPGFTITTETCKAYFASGGTMTDDVKSQIKQASLALEKKLGKTFGDPANPMLVSVRSGAKFSMPGMMDTILNLGLNDKTSAGLSKLTGNPRFAMDSYRRFIQTFGDVVLGIHLEEFESLLYAARDKAGVKYDYEIPAEVLAKLADDYKAVVKKHYPAGLPQDPHEQLLMAVEAVFKSWNTPRAKTYRKLNNISEDLGTACNVQAMVFGNMGDRSGTGVAFSRNPSTGEDKIYGEFLVNAQGEDVVAGIRTPQSIDNLHQVMPEQGNQLFDIIHGLDKHFKDMQDVEFTIEEGKLYILQTRNGKRTGAAALRVAVEACEAGYFDKEEALMRVDPLALNQLLHKQVDPKDAKALAKGLNASPGAAVGRIVLDPDRAVEMSAQGQKLILVRNETTPDDIHGLIASEGVLTARGGMTSHAAVVARGMGKPCVAGCSELMIDNKAQTVSFKGQKESFKEGDYITIDGTTGSVYSGSLPLADPHISDDFGKFLGWADKFRRLGVRTNADTPEDTRRAYEFGAEGIGLCRTEHMFMQQERLPHVRAMILAETEEERRQHLAKVKEFQKEDFIGIFREMHGHPVTVRLLDPPLHEFLPHDEAEIKEIIRSVKGDVTPEEMQRVMARVNGLHEANPMLGFRGCRLGLIFPEINEMQVEAILEAAIAVKKEGEDVLPEIMIPLIGAKSELAIIETKLRATAEDVFKRAGMRIEYKFGTMIEVPRAALTADEIAEIAEFFSFGTNDLTQMTLGISRDDAEEKFLRQYVEMGIYAANPFEQLDQVGVGKLIAIAVELGRKTNPNLKIGICGEHGGEPSSIDFCHRHAFNYVSCSPFRVPIARLSAAQSAISEKRGKSKHIGDK